MNIKLIAFIVNVTLLFIISCEGSLNGPEEPPEGRRDYIWKVDTIRALNHLTRLWGASPDDVWAVGEFGPHDKPIWHFDGEKWEDRAKELYISPYTIFGFATDNIWMGTLNGEIYHFDGNMWKLNYEKPEHLDFCVIADIWGKEPDDVYSVGYADSLGKMIGVIFHYNGNKWKRVSIDPQNITFHKIRACESNSKYYVRAVTKRVDTVKIYSLENGKVKEEYSMQRTNYTNCDIAVINDELYTIINNKIEKVGGGFPPFAINIDLEQFDETIFARSRNDIFLRMWDGIAHYNGSNSKYLVKFDTNQGFVNALLFHEEVFILSRDYTFGYTLIYRGKLIEK